MAFHNDRPRVAIPTTNRPANLHHSTTTPGNRSNHHDRRVPPNLNLRVTPPYLDPASEMPRLDNPWPYQPATPDTSLARTRSMVELSDRQSLGSSNVIGNGFLAFPEPQLSRSVTHSPAQQHASSSWHQPSISDINHSHGLQRQISSSSTASSYYGEDGSDPGVRFLSLCLRFLT